MNLDQAAKLVGRWKIGSVGLPGILRGTWPAFLSPSLTAEFLKITPVFIIVLPGVIGYVLWQKGAFQLHNVPGARTARTITPCCR